VAEERSDSVPMGRGGRGRRPGGGGGLKGEIARLDRDRDLNS